MRVSWHFTNADRKCVKTIISEQWEKDLVQSRINRNLADQRDKITRAEFWKALVCTRITTRARIIPNGKHDKFQRHFPLRYKVVSEADQRERLIYEKLRAKKVGTDPKKIAKQLAENFDFLACGGWQETRQYVNMFTTPQSREVEAKAAYYLADNFKGFGPKQSRNILQHLGLTRYEIPLDSRVTKWLNKNLGFPFEVSSRGLADKHFYGFVLDAICRLCVECEVFPCVLDAAIFAANGGGDDEGGNDDEE